jgi:hypothetical protein
MGDFRAWKKINLFLTRCKAFAPKNGEIAGFFKENPTAKGLRSGLARSK